ncbi:MAG: hypothetical protein AAGA69_11160 [Pseudomonadota bacterium]
MTDLRVEQKFEYPVGRIVPLQSRGPAWLSFSLGTLVSSAASAGIPAALLFFVGQGLSMVAVAAAGGFLLFCLLVSLLVCAPDRRTGSALFAGFFGVGHTLLLGFLLAALFVPGGQALVASTLAQIPLLSALPVASGAMGAAAPLYLLAFVTFSALAPIALLIFRYLALSRPEA